MPSPVPTASPSASAPSAHSAEQRVRTLLAEEKWRQARDELKALIKADRARFLPLLIQANIGLARKMLAGGQAAEARQVLSYLAAIAPPSELRALELELAMRSATPGQSLPQFFTALADPPAPLAEAERRQLADLLVMGFESVAVPGTTPAQVGLAAELRAIHAALAALAAQQWSVVSEQLRLVSHRSALSHWTVFIKGVAAFHADDTDRAGRLFQALPPRTTPARAAQPYLVLLGDLSAAPASVTLIASAPKPASAPSGGLPLLTEAVVDQVGRLIGAVGVSGTLLRAERHWREGGVAESYRATREGVPAFPSLEPDWVGALTEFYFKAPHTLTETSRAKLMSMFDGLLVGQRWKNPVESLFSYRMFSLVDAAIAPVEILRKDWGFFLVGRRALRGPNPQLESLAYGWLGEQLARSSRPPGFFPSAPVLRDAKGAVEVLQKSITLDPANLDAHLRLCGVYDALKETSERNRLLDTMTARFPDEKLVLLRAAESCLDRRAFVKGLAYLARARQLDQLDPRIPELTVSAYFQQARQQFQQGHAPKGRQSVAEAAPWLTDRTEDFSRARWTSAVWLGVFERRWGDPTHAAAAEALARAGAPSRSTQLFFAHVAHRLSEKRGPCESPYLAEFKTALRADRSVGEILRLLRIGAYGCTQWEDLRPIEENRLLAEALGASLERPFTRADAVELLTRAGEDFGFERPLQRLVKKVLHADPLDPVFRLWEVTGGPQARFHPPPERHVLQPILDEAIRRRDEVTTRRVRAMLRDLDHPPLPPPPDGYDPVFDGSKAAEAAEDFLHPPGLPPELAPEYEELLEALRTASPADLRAIHETRLPEMPLDVFDVIVGIAKGGLGLPRPPRAPRKPVRPIPPTNQLDLF